jgi:RNA polymerase sigma factor (sigma-70 family)
MRSSGDEAREVAVPESSGGADRERAEELVLRLVGSQADSLLRVARRYSLCADDAHDAYQRGLEILMRHAARLDPERAAGWLHTVVKHEALAINRSRRRLLGSGDIDLDALEARTSASPEDRLLSSDRVARSAEALHGLKPQEVRALWLKALGHSYEQICEATGWTYTKVNRCLAEGRKSFLERYAGIESGRECERLAPALSALVDGEADGAQAVELRNHLRQCLACRAAVRGLHDASRPLTVVLPAAGMIAAGGGAEQTSGLFVRVYETLTVHLNERAANSLLRAQAIVDAVTASKLAAAAASAAAVAGGGVAVEGALTSPGHQPAAIMRRVEGTASLAFAKQASQPRSGAKGSRTRSQDRRAKGDRRRAPAQRRAASPAKRASSSPARPRPRPSPPPATTTASSTAGAPRASAASAGTAPAGSAAAGEFGFEGP